MICFTVLHLLHVKIVPCNEKVIKPQRVTHKLEKSRYKKILGGFQGVNEDPV
uniref:Uncharacterized protein n=1 Tax=Arundo donax TaxID=35708 RepID=A0A0A9HVJ9_ARUDO